MKLSIITINRNNAGGLLRTLESTLEGQPGFQDWEQIVVDGASTDKSGSVIDRFRGHPRIGGMVSEPDSGIYNAMNKGAGMAKGDFFLFLNSGDVLVTNVLERVFSYPWNEDIAYGDLFLGQNPGARLRRYPDGQEVKPHYFLHSYLPHPASFISSRTFFAAGGYDERYRIAGDTAFFISAASIGASFVHLPFPVSRFDMSGISNKKQHRMIQLEERKMYLEPLFGPRLALVSLMGSQFADLLPPDFPEQFACRSDIRTFVSSIPGIIPEEECEPSAKKRFKRLIRGGKAAMRMKTLRERCDSNKAERMTGFRVKGALHPWGIGDDWPFPRESLEEIVRDTEPESIVSSLRRIPLPELASRFSGILPAPGPDSGKSLRAVVVAQCLRGNRRGNHAAHAIESFRANGCEVVLATNDGPSARDVPVHATYSRVALPKKLSDVRGRAKALLSILRERDPSVVVFLDPTMKTFFRDIFAARLGGVPVVVFPEKPLWSQIEVGGTGIPRMLAAFRMSNAVVAPSDDHMKSLTALGAQAVSRSVFREESAFRQFRALLFSPRSPSPSDCNASPEGRMLGALIQMYNFGVINAKNDLADPEVPSRIVLKGPPHVVRSGRLPLRCLLNSLNRLSRSMRRMADRISRS